MPNSRKKAGNNALRAAFRSRTGDYARVVCHVVTDFDIVNTQRPTCVKLYMKMPEEDSTDGVTTEWLIDQVYSKANHIAYNIENCLTPDTCTAASISQVVLDGISSITYGNGEGEHFHPIPLTEIPTAGSNYNSLIELMEKRSNTVALTEYLSRSGPLKFEWTVDGADAYARPKFGSPTQPLRWNGTEATEYMDNETRSAGLLATEPDRGRWAEMTGLLACEGILVRQEYVRLVGGPPSLDNDEV